MKEISAQLEQIKALCGQCRVRSLFAFGSAVRDELSPESDLDFIVDLEAKDPFEYSDAYFELKTQLQNIFHRDIDLLEQKALKNRFLRQEIDQSKQLVYGK